MLMAEANIYWNREDYDTVERLFKQSAEFCSVHDVWRLNLAHVFFIQDTKYNEAIHYYETILRKNMNNLLGLTAIVIANLCVSYIMVEKNDQAEEIIRNLEEAEVRAFEENPDKQQYHLCTVNLVIGTLYCSKGNYEFGIGRIIKSFDPYQKKLGPDTWYYAKRCFLSLIEKMAKKKVLNIPDRTVIEMLDFLENCEQYGKEIMTNLQPLAPQDTKTIAEEARILKRMFIRLRD